MQRKVLKRGADGQFREVYVDCGPSKALTGHGRPIVTLAPARGGVGIKQFKLRAAGGGQGAS